MNSDLLMVPLNWGCSWLKNLKTVKQTGECACTSASFKWHISRREAWAVYYHVKKHLKIIIWRKCPSEFYWDNHTSRSWLLWGEFNLEPHKLVSGPEFLLIDNFLYIEIQPKTIDLTAKLWGINTEFVGFIPQSLVLRSIVLGWILIYRNWSIMCYYLPSIGGEEGGCR